MLELTRTPRTDGYVEVCAVVPASRAAAVSQAILEAAEPNLSREEAFADSSSGKRLRGARGLREMTQAQLAAKVGVNKSNISEMERGVRPIGKVMAKRLGESLDFPYKTFL